MKMSPELTKAQANMQPGVITSTGFLGEDPRPLVDIMEADTERLGALGIDTVGAAELMQRLLDEGKAGLGEPITVENRWLVQIYEARGVLACPWEDGVSHKINAVVENLKTGRRLLYSELSLHLMAKHGFFQGKGSPFRIDPDTLKDVLEL